MGEMVSRPNPDGETWQGDVSGKYFQSYAYRMIPFTIGCFPYFSAFAVIIRFYYRVIEDVQEVFEVDDVIPVWIYSALVAVLTTFSSFTVIQMIVLYRAPRHFWVSEVCYAVLSLTSKGCGLQLEHRQYAP